MSRFIVFEGIDGCGKSTQAKMLATGLEMFGESVLLTKEPGGSRTVLSTSGPGISDTTGDRFRKSIFSQIGPYITPLSRAFLFSADRAEHVADTIRPALADGRTVICDRYRLSNLTYQYADGVPSETLRTIDDIACQGVHPDRYLLLDVPVDIAVSRATERNYYEKRGRRYHERVREAYLSLARTEPNVLLIDGTGSENDVAELVWGAVQDIFGWAA